MNWSRGAKSMLPIHGIYFSFNNVGRLSYYLVQEGTKKQGQRKG